MEGATNSLMTPALTNSWTTTSPLRTNNASKSLNS